MTKLYPPNEVARWKRSFIGGLLSAAIASSCIVLLIFGILAPRGIFFFLLLGFGYPGMLSGYSNNVLIVLSVAMFWFLAGALIGYFARKNISAIGIWLILYAVSFAFALAFFAEINN